MRCLYSYEHSTDIDKVCAPFQFISEAHRMGIHTLKYQHLLNTQNIYLMLKLVFSVFNKYQQINLSILD